MVFIVQVNSKNIYIKYIAILQFNGNHWRDTIPEDLVQIILASCTNFS